ncbi:hypothetical protein NP603_02710 [Methylomonas sp. SURF-1]|uniref:Uncharacterized protein n=1 Tax=Methylomonas aurea TaxID=2952224 RepID=A0ABT1UCY8_9GAMM|nr:hypothetical protein [Methylomonas sp. SURF-1]MCQ8180010.1 hypothetical protein [Methylomonas sp. SURF-1]
MTTNPEFERQLLLECPPARLSSATAVLGTVFAFCYFLDDYRFGSISSAAALGLFWLITLLWGARQSLDSIVDEYRDRTWDTQRLSALDPWQMAWGKLLGSTSMVWYCAGFCLLVYTLAAGQSTDLLRFYFYAIAGGLLVQSAALLLGLLAVGRGQTKTGSILLPALIGFAVVAPQLGDLSEIAGLGSAGFRWQPWYGWQFAQQDFHRFSLLCAVFWCMVANYRLLAQALGLRKPPTAWLGFIVFLVVYLGGLIPSGNFALAMAGFGVCGGLTYLSVVAEPQQPMQIKRLLDYYRQHNWRRVIEEFPLSWLSFALAVPFALYLSANRAHIAWFELSLHSYPLAALLLILRDCAIYVYFCYGKNPQRALNLSLLAAVLLYGVLPGLFGALGLSGLSALFFPLWADSASGAVLYAVLQCAAVLRLLYRRWQNAIC